jgi:translation elongation factor P/translation initiation factor 5A
MKKGINYGREGKKIVFYDTDKRHVELKIRLKHDRLTQAEFFRTLITGYLDKDENVLLFLDKYILENGKLRKKNLFTNRALIKDGKDVEKAFALGEDEIENIFDLLEEEHPEL